MLWMIALLISAPKPEADKAIDVLSECTDVNQEVCILAAARLKIIGNEALAPLARRIESIGRAGQLLVLSAVADGREPEVADLLIKLARSKTADAPVRALAIDGLAKRRDPRVTVLAPTLLRDPASLVRQAGVRVVASGVTAHDKRRIGLLVKAAKDEAAPVRAEAAFGLGFCNCDEAGPVLTKALADPAIEVQHAATEGLSFVKHPKAVHALVPLLRSSSDLVSHAAGRALRFQTDENLGDDPQAWERWLASRP